MSSFEAHIAPPPTLTRRPFRVVQNAFFGGDPKTADDKICASAQANAICLRLRLTARAVCYYNLDMKKPIITKAQAEQIKKTYPTPFHIYDEKGIKDNAKRLLDAFSWCKGFKEHFAVKATPNPTIMKLLHSLGCGMDCSSMTELMLCEKCGITGDDIMFTSNETPAEEYAYALKLGATITLDDITHVDFLADIAGGKMPEVVSLRYNNGKDFAINKQIMGTPQDAKYGMTREQLTEAVRRLIKLGVKRFGLHAFLASNNLGNEYYPTLAGILFDTASELHDETGADFAFVNLSGGIGIPYLPTDEMPDIYAIAAGVKREYDRVFTKDMKPSLRTELGRFMLGPYGNLITTVVHFKHIYKEYAGVDACAANLMRPAMYGAYHHITVLGKENAPCDHKYDVVGSLCENNDKFAVDRMLPELEIGDILAIHDAGAHGFAMGYNYNGKLRSAELLLREDGSVKMIRRAETPDDYFATMVFD